MMQIVNQIRLSSLPKFIIQVTLQKPILLKMEIVPRHRRTALKKFRDKWEMSANKVIMVEKKPSVNHVNKNASVVQG